MTPGPTRPAGWLATRRWPTASLRADRWRAARRAAAVCVVAAGLAGCGGGHAAGAGPGGGRPDAPPGPSTSRPSPRPTPSMTPPTTPSTTAPPLPGAPAASPDAAAAALVDAWAAGDRAAAARVATSSAVASLFALPYPRGALQARGCTEGVSPGTCTYRNLTTGGIYELGLLDGPAGWYVDAVTPES